MADYFNIYKIKIYPEWNVNLEVIQYGDPDNSGLKSTQSGM